MKKIRIIIITIMCIGFFKVIYADSISDAQSKVSDIKKQIQENSSAISSVEDEVEEYLSDIEDISDEISGYSQKVDEINEKIDTVNSKIKEYEEALQNSSQSYNSAQQLYLTRLRIIYENGTPSMIDTFFASKSITDFFSRLNILNSILDYDKTLIGNMKSQKEYVDYIKKDIDNEKIQLEQLKYDLEKTTTSLETAKDNKESKVNKLNESKTTMLAANKILIEQQEKAESELQKEISKAQSSGGTYTKIFGGDLQWPVASTKINATYGYYSPFGFTQLHTGVDIGGVGYTSPVYAAADGKVITAKTITSNPDGPDTGKYSAGYGNYVMVSHGKKNGVEVTTIYGHLSSVNVKVGDLVYQGTTKLGITGNTGYSTGAHLHFEIRENGKAVNPNKYFTFLK